MLQVSYSFFNQLGPSKSFLVRDWDSKLTCILDTWFLVGTAARLALGMGLHTASTYTTLPSDTAERCKRVFFSIYMMDRYVDHSLRRRTNHAFIHRDSIRELPYFERF